MSNRTVEQIMQAHETSGRYFDVAGVRTFALDYGQGEPVFCVHGVPTSSYLFRKMLRSLADQGLRGISVDMPGLGLSDRPADFDYTFRGFARFLHQATEALGLDSYHLVVHDIGGAIGLALAAEHPERIKSLTILNMFYDVVNFQKPLPMRPFEMPVLGEAELLSIQHPTWYLLFKGMGVSNISELAKEEVYAYVDLLKRDDGGKAFLKIMRQFDHSQELQDLMQRAVDHPPYPVQAIWGAEDPALDFEHFGKLVQDAAHLPTVHKLASKHFFPEEKGPEIAQLITDFIRPQSS
ncbi:alpha/beta fold hydrolase [Hymenobacter psychrophilus]|uniref:Pimeloyl-ACP methyl ester carboxylesterase n=1 Tax=Hymenobacter psychrophilus TaxID=651662 RepID=A0A1H3BBS8_9BACT|nr:alpha/beta hydrolase [Hymenobacter psychrophilus]SDX39235.1 Pimeloyl-ACP methyl ester carboxylesterase [Hymenobacter psychrophilus]